MFYIKNGTIVTENDIFRGFIGIENGIISLVGIGEPPDKTEKDINAGGLLVTPGFIDIHCHGGGGKLFAEDPKTAYEAHRRKGTLGIIPTIAYNMPWGKIISAVGSIAEMEEEGVLGINMEGPFINPEYGAESGFARKIERKAYEDLYEAGNGQIKIWMFSPDIADADELKEFIITKPEIISCAGHTECTAVQLEGIELICHLFDAMGPKERPGRKAIHENGTAEAVLASDHLYAELIADSKGVHVPAELLKIAYRCLGDRNILISDAVSTKENGSDLNYNEQGELSGSLLSLNEAIRNMKKHTGINWPEAVRLGTLNPAKLLGIDKETGSIEPGKKADLVIMNEEANIHSVIAGGRRL